jgi:NADH:ubiquinone oxidoreductase subunit 6 (subunit J)
MLLKTWALIILILGLFAGIISINPINSIIGLILIFMASAVYFIILGINFIAFLYLIIYVGAIAILFLFVIMMINIKFIEIQNDYNEKLFKTIPLIAFFISLLLTIYSNQFDINYNPFVYYSNNLFNWSISLHNYLSGPILPIAKILYTNYFLYLITFSLLLLLAMVGPIILFIS